MTMLTRPINRVAHRAPIIHAVPRSQPLFDPVAACGSVMATELLDARATPVARWSPQLRWSPGYASRRQHLRRQKLPGVSLAFRAL